ncbi:MAG: S-layer homology domain-containing protein [Ruminiclostridium sp.]|nr:S-layer homology domain-containing protein [Ruminiclostridium sp.]
MNTLWKNLTALGLTLCLSLSLLAMPAQATLAEEQEAQEEAVVTAEASAEPTPASYAPALRQDHVRYMQGFPEGTFQPESQLTRAQAAQLVYRLLQNPDWGYGYCSYVDVPSWEWYAQPVTALCRLGLFDDGYYFRPNDIITRAEFVDLLVRLRPDAYGVAYFPDVPSWHWAADAIGAAVSLGWITGYPEGTFGPERGLTRAEACTVVNRMTERTGDEGLSRQVIGLGLYSDVTLDHWAWQTIAEASVSHDGMHYYGQEYWLNLDVGNLTFTSGIHTVDGELYYVDRFGQLVTNDVVGAYVADETGLLTKIADSYQMPGVEYFSQIDNLYAWVGCESVATFTGLRALGYAQDVELRTFVTDQPRSPTTDPEKGFVGDPFIPDRQKKTRTTIYPAKLAEYTNSYCDGETPAADFRGSTIEELRQELLAGNCVVGYMTLWWEKPNYRNYDIEGTTQRLVSNNHAVLVCGYDPQKGYFISDPYNYDNRGQVYQYWEPASVFEPIWNERQVGMIMRH